MTQITQTAWNKLKAELDECLAKRPEITENIKKTKEMGDLRENAGYHDARERQSFNEGRIKEIEEILKHAEIVEKCESTECVGLGSSLKIVCINNQTEMDCQIVSFAEANPAQRKFSDQSPLAQALLGKKKNEKVMVKTPNGEMEYQILEIK